jgi:hypothetical protein
MVLALSEDVVTEYNGQPLESTVDGDNGVLISLDATNLISAEVGDFNGDGFNDVVVGNPLGNGGAGEVYVVYGGTLNPDGTRILSPSTQPSTQGFRIAGVVSGGRFGQFIGPCGDWNSDGLADFCVGAPGANAPTQTAGTIGHAYIIMGSTASRTIDLTTALANSHSFILSSDLGAADGSELGACVCTAGDFDGDGFDDIQVTAPGDTADAGSVTILFGSSTVGSQGSFDIVSEGFTVTGNAASRLGTHCNVGNFNNDGFSDIIVGAPGEDRAQVILGAAAASFSATRNAVVGIDSVAAAVPKSFAVNAGTVPAGYALFGPTGSSTGAWVSSADVDCDDVSDILIGAPNFPDAATANGRGYVVFGGSAFPGTGVSTVTLSSLPAANGFSITTTGAGYQLGISIAGVPDLDNDGCDDFCIGACGTDLAGTDSGSVFCFLGSATRGKTTGTFDVSAVAAPTEFRTNGERAGQLLGINLSGGQNFAQNAVGILLGASNVSTGNGFVFVIFGERLPTPTPTPPTPEPTRPRTPARTPRRTPRPRTPRPTKRPTPPPVISAASEELSLPHVDTFSSVMLGMTLSKLAYNAFDSVRSAIYGKAVPAFADEALECEALEAAGSFEALGYSPIVAQPVMPVEQLPFTARPLLA